jgi:hydrogenase large subunit
MATIVIDPLTRIEGHNRWVVTAAGANLTVSSAKSSGTLFRGFELIMKTRDPRDGGQICQRICGV